MAHSLHFEVLQRVAGEWPLFLGIAFAVMAASALLGYWLMRSGLLPGSTAIWGLAPGAASAMVLMAGDFGADTRLVAFMQYLRGCHGHGDCFAGSSTLQQALRPPPNTSHPVGMSSWPIGCTSRTPCMPA